MQQPFKNSIGLGASIKDNANGLAITRQIETKFFNKKTGAEVKISRPVNTIGRLGGKR